MLCSGDIAVFLAKETIEKRDTKKFVSIGCGIRHNVILVSLLISFSCGMEFY